MPTSLVPVATDLHHGVLHTFLGLLFSAAAIIPPFIDGFSFGWIVLLWPALNLLLLGASYLCNGKWGVWLLGKSKSTGVVSLPALVFFFPYLLGMYSFWYLKHMCLGEQVCNQVAAGIWVGRFPLNILSNDSRFDNRLTHVVDLTCEFPSRRAFHGNIQTYLCAPSLDRLLADPRTLLDCAKKVLNDSDSCTYVHCANGHGRSGLFAGMLLVMRGECKDLDAAKIFMRKKRSVINWQPHQQAVAQLSLDLWSTSRSEENE
jgi:protein-tyrosine phosphatase